MNTAVTCFGGVGQIGGNKLLIEDRDTKVILDFGTGFTDGEKYFDSVIKPRPVNGAGDYFEFGLLPALEGFYSERALQNTELKFTSPQVDAIVLSHYHSDHMGRISFVDPRIPVYCGETTSLIHRASSESSGSPLDDHELKTFRTGAKFKIGALEFIPVHVDHSIPGAYGFVIHTSQGTLGYTGDFRFHGGAGKMTEDFIEVARDSGVQTLLSEGTRVAPEGQKKETSEREVLEEAKRIVGTADRLVLSTFRGNDVDRINTFYEAAEAMGRRLVVSMKAAILLEKLQSDGGIKVPRVGEEVSVYVRRKKSGKLDDRDYFPWERRFLDAGLSASDVRMRQREIFLHLDAWNFPELIDIKPDRGGTYIHSATEAFNEEGEQEESVIKNWTAHLGFSYHQLHASGHAPMSGVGRMIEGAGTKRVIPIHTEHPEMFPEIVPSEVRVEIPKLSVPISLAN